MKYLQTFENWDEPDSWTVEIAKTSDGYCIATFGIYGGEKRLWTVLTEVFETKEEALNDYRTVPNDHQKDTVVLDNGITI